MHFCLELFIAKELGNGGSRRRHQRIRLCLAGTGEAWGVQIGRQILVSC
jgi:hypothetical protein